MADWTQEPKCPHCGSVIDGGRLLCLGHNEHRVLCCPTCETQYRATAHVTTDYLGEPWSELDRVRSSLSAMSLWEHRFREAGSFDLASSINDETCRLEAEVARLEREQ